MSTDKDYLPLGASLSCDHRDPSIHIERALHEALLWPVLYWPKMGIVKAKKLGLMSKIFLFSKTAKDRGNKSADIFLVMLAVGQAGHSLSVNATISMDKTESYHKMPQQHHSMKLFMTSGHQTAWQTV